MKRRQVVGWLAACAGGIGAWNSDAAGGEPTVQGVSGCVEQRRSADSALAAAEARRTDHDAWESAANQYETLWKTYGEESAQKRSGVQCQGMDEIVMSAAKAWGAARRIDRAIANWKLMLDPKNKLRASDLTRSASYTIAFSPAST